MTILLLLLLLPLLLLLLILLLLLLLRIIAIAELGLVQGCLCACLLYVRMHNKYVIRTAWNDVFSTLFVFN